MSVDKAKTQQNKIQENWKLEMQIAFYQFQREIRTVVARAAPGDLGLKSHPKHYQQKLTYDTNTVIHLSTNQGRCCLTPVYQAGDRSSMSINIDIILIYRKI